MGMDAVMLGVLAVMAVVECRQGTTLPTMEAATPPQTQDKSTLRQLVDPKFRRTLLKVLNKLGGNDRVGETDVTDDEFLRLVGQKASAEDLGTVEESREQGHSQDTYPSQEFNYLPPPTDSPQQQPEGKYPATNPTPQRESIFVQFPAPIESPDTDDKTTMDYPPSGSEGEEDGQEDDLGEEEEETVEEKKDSGNSTVTIETSSSISSSIVEGPQINSTKKNEKHEVEFLNSALVAAFTVQQDDRGIPRKVIPLSYPQNFNAIQRGLQEKEALLERELRLLRQQQEAQERELQRIRLHRGGFKNPQEEARRRQQAILFGQQEIYRQQELRRQQELQMQQELRRQQELQRQQEARRQLEFQRQQEYFRQQSFHQPSVDFQPSIDYQIDARRRPSFFIPQEVGHNRVNRQEPAGQWGNAGVNPTPDLRLQSLLLQSGVSGEEPEDISILSKVLALDHGIPRPQTKHLYGRGRFDSYPGPPPLATPSFQ